MADNRTVTNTKTSFDADTNADYTVAADEIGGAVYQRFKLTLGADGTSDGDVASGNPLPVTGTVTANIGTVGTLATAAKQDTGNTSLATIAGAVSGTEMQVDVLTSALPTGAATSAKQDTIIGHVDGIEGLLTTIDADTGNISTKIDTLAGAVSGTEVQVDVLTSALPTGAATSAKQDTIISHLSDISDNTATTSPIGDTVVSDGGAMPFAVGIAGYDGTNAQFIKTDSDGNLQVDVLTMPSTTVTATNLDIRDLTSVSDSVAAVQSGTWNITDISGTVSLPTGAATSAKQDTIITAVQLLDDVVATDGAAALTKLYQVGGTDGTNAQILSTNSSGHLNIADGGNTITVDGTVNAAQSGTWNITNVSGTVSLPTGASTLAEQQTQTTALQLIDDCIGTHDSAATTKLAQSGGKAYASSALPSVVSANDAVISTHDLQGRQIIAPYTGVPLSAYLALTSSAENTIIAAPGSGLQIIITSVTCTATGGASVFVFRKGTGGSIFLTLGASGTTAMGHAASPTGWPVGDNTLVSLAPTVATATQTSITYYIAAS